MTQIKTYVQQMGDLFQQLFATNEFWRFAAALVVVCGGLLLLEIVFRRLRHRWKNARAERGKPAPEAWHLEALLPSLRLGGLAVFLRTARGFLSLPSDLAGIFQGIESLLFALAAILLFFYFINLIDRVRASLPPRLQQEFPSQLFLKMKGLLRLCILIGVAIAYAYFQKKVFPPWLWESHGWRYLLFFLVIGLVYMAIRLIGRTLTLMAVALKESAENERLRMILQSTIWPFRLLFSTIAIYAAREILSLPAAAGRLADTVVSFLSTLAVVIFLYRLIEVMVFELERLARREDNLLDESFANMIRLIARVLVIVFGAIYLIQSISGKPLSALLAGLGIGGLAVALAAQDTLKNFFGSIMIMLDRPFKVGQRITIDSYDGVVEAIGFRSTRIRTLTGHLVTIPNEKMALANVENIAQRPSIRRLANITITYDTPPDKIEKALSIVREILQDHEGMHPDFPPRVFFNEFNDTSLNIIMIYWYFPPDYWKYMAFSEAINLKIMRAFEAEGIEFAFPTTTTYLAQDNRRPLQIRLSGSDSADPIAS